jgi:fatty acid desaturase
MVFQRYRSALPDKVLAARVWFVAVGVLGSAGAINVIFGYSTYLCVLSSIVLGCTAASFYWLSLAREEPHRRRRKMAQLAKPPGLRWYPVSESSLILIGLQRARCFAPAV